jgi:hypothetical protein
MTSNLDKLTWLNENFGRDTFGNVVARFNASRIIRGTPNWKPL